MAQYPQKVNPQVGYEFDAFPLNGGLDLISPKINAPKGSLLDCSNREVVDRIGYRRIDGFEPYDGRTSPAQSEFYYIESTTYTPSVSFAVDFANGFSLVSSTANTTIFGVVASRNTFVDTPTPGTTTYRIYFALVNEEALPAGSTTVLSLAGAVNFPITSAGVYTGSESLTDNALALVQRYNGYQNALRANIGAMRDTPIGLHWYRDKLYAVTDDATFYFKQASGTTPIITNSLISKDSGVDTARVLSLTLTNTDWAGGNAAGMMTVEVLTGSWASGTGASVTAPTNTTTFDLVAATSSSPQPLYASLWRSRSEEQAQEDTAPVGWQRIDHGWEIDYSVGFSETDGLTVVERGSENNFVFDEGSELQFPTTIINGNNIIGSSYAVYSRQPATTTRVDNGDPGWKTNASATVFAGSTALDTALRSADANYAYANLWYIGTSSGNGGIPQGVLSTYDRDIYGPVDSFNSRGAPSTITTGGSGSDETFDSDFFTTQARAPLLLEDFSAVVPQIAQGSIITGIQVTVSYQSQHYAEGAFEDSRNTAAVENTVNWVKNNFLWEAAVVNANTGTTATINGTPQTTQLVVETDHTTYKNTAASGGNPGAFTMAKTKTGLTATIGANGNTFGISNLTRNDLLNTRLGIALYGQVSGAPFYPLSPPMTNYASGGGVANEFVMGVVRVRVDRITVRFYYTTPSARYYVGDGTTAPANVCYVDVTYYVNEEGSFVAGTAEGTLQFTNLTAVTGGKRTVEAGDKFYLTQTAAENSTNPVLTVDSDAEYNGLPARNLLISNASRYEFITANFFGRDEWDGFYGVSGAGRAFSFATYDSDGDGDDEDYLIQITTSTLDRAGDIPRHVAFHHYALALGYRSGIVRFSVPGEPENFDGVDGAAEVGVGDKVTGLLSMKGSTLGVFCENSIWGIAGTDADNYATQVLAPYTGAIEYTVVDMGVPVYCDTRGISTLEQSASYGNFLGQRLSAMVSPFILPRMIRDNAQFSGKGVVCAVPFRSKNQYRLFFKDGKVLSLTMGPDGSPTFTFSNYYIGQVTLTETNKFMVPFAWSSAVDDKGIDRVHVSHFSPISTVSSANGKFVYEMDKGWGFAGKFIPNHYSVNWYYKDPFTNTTIKKIRLDGLTQGVSSCSVSMAKDYDTTFSSSSVDISLPINPLSSLSQDFIPASTIANVNERGRSITFKVSGTLSADLLISNSIPPDIHQIVLPHFDAGGRIDA